MDAGSEGDVEDPNIPRSLLFRALGRGWGGILNGEAVKPAAIRLDELLRIPFLGFENVVDAIADGAGDLQELLTVLPRVAGEISSVQLFYDGRLNGSKADRVPIEPNLSVVGSVSERLIVI